MTHTVRQLPRSALEAIDRLLRPDAAPIGQVRARTILLCLILSGLLYGAVMGSYGGVLGSRLLQVLFSALKVPLLLVVTFGLTLPSYFVLSTLLGLRRDLGQAVRGLIMGQAVLAIVLASLAPLTAVWYASSDSYHGATLFNAAMFTAASFAAQRPLRRRFRPLIRRNRKHRWMLWAYVTVYAFVGIQMGWVLRPFIGDPSQPTTFFRAEAWNENAYVVVARLIWRMISP